MDVYEIITKRIVESLEHGDIPWRKPWEGGPEGMPRNFMSTKPYRGVNVFLLTCTSIAKGYNSPFWVSYKQAQSLGGHVKAGEKSSCPVVFYKRFEKEEVNDDGEHDTYSMLRYTPMWNTDQCEGLSVPNIAGPEKHEHEIIASAERIVDAMPNRPEIRREKESARAFYRPSTDTVTVPLLAQFPKAEEFYSTLFHELGHSTGHQSRVGREFGDNFGDHTYSKEELVAEFSASYLCGVAGIESRTLENSSAYIASWLSVLKDKQTKKWIPWAAGQAQKAADYIQGINVAKIEEREAA